jgi:hypothetical protein
MQKNSTLPQKVSGEKLVFMKRFDSILFVASDFEVGNQEKKLIKKQFECIKQKHALLKIVSHHKMGTIKKIIVP